MTPSHNAVTWMLVLGVLLGLVAIVNDDMVLATVAIVNVLAGIGFAILDREGGGR